LYNTERPFTLNVVAESDVIVPYAAEMVWTPRVFVIVALDTVASPQTFRVVTVSVPDTFAFVEESVVTSAFGVYIYPALMVATLTEYSVERPETFNVVADRVVMVPLVADRVWAPRVLNTVALEIVASPQTFRVVAVSVPDTLSVVAESVPTIPNVPESVPAPSVLVMDALEIVASPHTFRVVVVSVPVTLSVVADRDPTTPNVPERVCAPRVPDTVAPPFNVAAPETLSPPVPISADTLETLPEKIPLPVTSSAAEGVFPIPSCIPDRSP
jgi:hypothetical protein